MLSVCVRQLSPCCLVFVGRPVRVFTLMSERGAGGAGGPCALAGLISCCALDIGQSETPIGQQVNVWSHGGGMPREPEDVHL